MEAQPFLKDLRVGEAFLGFLLVQEAAYKTSAKGSEYLEMKLSDATGDLKAFLWDLKAVEGEFDAIAPEAFVKVKAKVDEFNGRRQLRVEKVRFAEDGEVGDLSRFFPTSARPIPGMLAELDALIAGVADPFIRHLLEAVFIQDAERRAAFAQAPAAKTNHHVCLGGLLEHTLSVAAMAHRACDHYGDLNRDLVLAGVLLHDLGKTAELSYQRTFGYTDAGNLLGHISLEVEWINRAIEALPGFPEELRVQILHIVLAHHGRLEYGSPVVPKTPEALLVHYLDDLDGKLEAMVRVQREESGTPTWSPYLRGMERMVYKVRWPKAVRAEG
ncbi:MAG: 3'-5' exoribonuclease YhaM [Acidobacteria bacterium ADurb.Bin340]|nr:MAG: 3'-5' exoribonuclease YhaM [Acidobacteria bacterium ADurb.Bin340]HQL47677.1 HD domain-containing protein [Holophaga sp.]